MTGDRSVSNACFSVFVFCLTAALSSQTMRHSGDRRDVLCHDCGKVVMSFFFVSLFFYIYYYFLFIFNVGVGVTAVCGCVGVVLAVNMTRKAVHGKHDMTQQ